MYKIILTGRFKKSLKKIKKSNSHDISHIKKLIHNITNDKKLGIRFKDHKLRGTLSKLRECHIKTNLLLIYEKDKKDMTLTLVDIGSHSDLFN